jgi:hypothetical protein
VYVVEQPGPYALLGDARCANGDVPVPHDLLSQLDGTLRALVTKVNVISPFAALSGVLCG